MQGIPVGALNGTIVTAGPRYLSGHPGQESTFAVENDGRIYKYYIFTAVVEGGLIEYIAGGEEALLTDDSVACINRVADSLRLIAANDADSDGIVDAEDKCWTTPENYNGREDSDGCPD